VTEDTVRAPFDFVERLYKAVREAGADRLVISDTVGIMTPLTFRWYLEEFRRRVQPTDWSVHCHNDFGLAVANTLTALEAGVTSPHTCVNGLGERSGNAAFEEVALGLESLYGVHTGLKTDRLYELSRLVEEISGVPVAANKALVGYNSFSHEAGIHTHGILKHTLTYEPVQPEVLGRHRQMILGKHTGKAALVEKLKERHAAPSEAALAALLRQIKERTESESKEAPDRLLKEYRRYFEHLGLSDEEFWTMVADLKIPTENA
jgi:2-isopropylmalate synthase